MQYFRKDDLEELRKSSENIDGELHLFAVYKNLAHGVFQIKRMSKKYIYWFDDSKHPYPSRAAGYTLFDNKAEAWRYYKDLYEKRKADILAQYEADMKQLTRATIILNDCAEQTPEYFI